VDAPALPVLGPLLLAVCQGMLLIAALHCALVARMVGQDAYRSYARYFGLAALSGLLAPFGLLGRQLDASVANGSACLCAALALFAAFRVFRVATRGRPFWLGFASAGAAAALALLAAFGAVHAPWLGALALSLGLSLQALLLAAELGAQIKAAHVELSTVEGALSSELSAVSLALRTAEEASQRAERATRVRDEFIATMSHEFRTPLNPIINIPQGLRAEFVRVEQAHCAQCSALFELEPEDVLSPQTACPECESLGSLHKEQALSFAGDAARARALLTKVEHSGEHLLRVVNAILDYSKLEAQQLRLLYERFDARRLLRELLADHEPAAQRAQIQLALIAEERPLLVHADPHRLREVLTHLIDNAIKFRRGAGKVVVTMHEQAERIDFSVADQGVGIAQEHLESVFTSFEQVSKGNTRSHGGTGLGLSMARSLVRMHGGEITASSELHVGSTFSFWIPRGAPARASARSLKRLSAGASS
jgi:signal transduction histidine kinase